MRGLKRLVKIETIKNNLLIKFENKMHMLSTSYIDGITESDKVVISQVNENIKINDFKLFRENVISSLGLSNEVPVMATSVNIKNYKIKEREMGGVLITASFEIPNCIYQENLFNAEKGTINIIAWLNHELTFSGLLDLFRTVTESKCLSASDLLIRCKSRSSGTSSDGITVAAKISKNGYMWSGLSTKHGNYISRLIHETLISFEENKEKDELLKRSLGLDINGLVEEAIKLYQLAPVPGKDINNIRILIKHQINNFLNDPNVWSFIIAAREIDLRGESNTFPFLAKEEYEKDTKRIIADEALASSLSIYLSGFKGLTATYWVDSSKDRLNLSISRLPMFEDDIASALIGSALSKIYDYLFGGNQ
ncbi:MAG: adenosylcobinamide amidohydrolase [Caldisphaera sp.]|jgi:alpha-ribazole phosphatase CobZ|nr:adenosylcobinamide amidohydrolase [Caldisphaera sp.]